MGSAFHQLCPRYSGTLTPTAPTAIRLWDTFTITLSKTNSVLINQSLSRCFGNTVFFSFFVGTAFHMWMTKTLTLIKYTC